MATENLSYRKYVLKILTGVVDMGPSPLNFEELVNKNATEPQWHTPLPQKALTPKNLGKNLRPPTGFSTVYHYVYSFLSIAFPIKDNFYRLTLNFNLNKYDGVNASMRETKWLDKFSQLETFTAFFTYTNRARNKSNFDDSLQTKLKLN
jgi:hypothetical protein